MSALICDAVVSGDHIRVVDSFSYRVREQRACKKWGDGAALKIRVELEGDAKTYGQLKWWHGYVVAPLIEYTGDVEWALLLKAMFLPPEKHGLTDLNYDEMRAFSEQSEAWCRLACPEAYEKHGREYVA